MRLLEPLLPEGVLCGEIDPADVDTDLLSDEERADVARAIPRRVREFAAGRQLAHELLERLGARRAPLCNGPDRAPIWPAGFVGSISHTGRLAVAIVARMDKFAALGCDIEPDGALEEGLWDLILRPEERCYVSTQFDPGRVVRRIFSAKEAAYKAWYPSCGVVLEHHDVHIQLGQREGDSLQAPFIAKLQRDAGTMRAGSELRGYWRNCGGLVATAVSVGAISSRRDTRVPSDKND